VASVTGSAIKVDEDVKANITLASTMMRDETPTEVLRRFAAAVNAAGLTIVLERGGGMRIANLKQGGGSAAGAAPRAGSSGSAGAAPTGGRAPGPTAEEMAAYKRAEQTQRARASGATAEEMAAYKRAEQAQSARETVATLEGILRSNDAAIRQATQQKNAAEAARLEDLRQRNQADLDAAKARLKELERPVPRR